MNTKLDSIFLLIFFVLIGLIIIGQIIWIFKTENRLKRFFLGKKAKDLEDTIVNLQDEITKLKSQMASTEKNLDTVNQKLKKSIRGLDTIRFNPFPDQGSNQSFAIGMMNEEGNGVVISSLYSRERMSIFAKPIKNNKSEFELTNEEKEVLEKAKVS